MSWNVGQVVNLVVTDDEDDTRIDRWLKRKFHGLTQGQIEKALRKGEIRVDGARAKSNTRVKAGQKVRVPPMAAPHDEAPRDDGGETTKHEREPQPRCAAARRGAARGPRSERSHSSSLSSGAGGSQALAASRHAPLGSRA